MSRKEEFLVKAREAEGLADKFPSSEKSLRQAAAAWRLLADLEDRLSRARLTIWTVS